MPLHLSGHTGQLISHRIDFYEMWRVLFKKNWKEKSSFIKLWQNNGHFTWGYMYITISRSSRFLLEWVIFQTNFEEKIKTHFVFKNFFNVLLTVHHSISVYWNQRDALLIQLIENQRPVHVSSIIYSSSAGATQTVFGTCVLRAYNVSRLCHGHCNRATANWQIRKQYTKCCLCNASWGWASIARNMQSPLILNKLNEKCIMLVSVYFFVTNSDAYTLITSSLETSYFFLSYVGTLSYRYRRCPAALLFFFLVS
jgi:hypothetical protein